MTLPSELSDTVCMFCKSTNLKINPKTGNQYCGDCFCVQKAPVYCFFKKLNFNEPNNNGETSDESTVFQAFWTSDPDGKEQTCPSCEPHRKLLRKQQQNKHESS